MSQKREIKRTEVSLIQYIRYSYESIVTLMSLFFDEREVSVFQNIW